MSNLIRAVSSQHLGATAIYETDVARILLPQKGRVIFVRVSDSGSGTGSKGSPHSRLESAVRQASAGDTVAVSGAISTLSKEIRAAIRNKKLRIYAGFDTGFATLSMPLFERRNRKRERRACPPYPVSAQMNDPDCNEPSRN